MESREMGRLLPGAALLPSGGTPMLSNFEVTYTDAFQPALIQGILNVTLRKIPYKNKATIFLRSL